MRCLIVIPDMDSGSGSCVKEVAYKLLNSGHSVICLTNEDYKDEILDIRTYHFFKRRSSWRLSLKRILLYPIWPFFSVRLYFCIKKSVQRIINTEQIDVIVAVYNPIESLLAIHFLRRRYGFKYVAYFLDALYAGQKPRYMVETLKRKYALFWERHVLRNADLVIMMKAAENAYTQLKTNCEYLNRTVFLDLPLYVPYKITQSERTLFPRGQIVLFYAGALPNNIRDPRYLLELFSSANIPNCHLYIAGRGDYDIILNKYSQKCNNIHILGTITREEVKQRSLEADFLINIGNNLRNMVPSKIFEYMSTGKPIIATSKIPDDPSLLYLNQYPRALVLCENDRMDKNIILLNRFLNNKIDVTIAPGSFELNRPETFVKHIERLI